MMRFVDVTVTYRTPERTVKALRGVSLDLKPGLVTGLVGESGSGKSTMLYAALRLLPPQADSSGAILADGVNLLELKQHEMNRYRWKYVSYVPQGAMNSLTPVLTVGSQIDETLRRHLDISAPQARERRNALLEKVNLDRLFANRYPHELSGGQKQRVSIAMAIACGPRFILADEPTTALDVITQAEVISLLADLVREEGSGLLLVTHDLALASSVSDRLAVLHRGLLAEEGKPAEILAHPVHEHTRALVRALGRKGGATP